MLLHYVEMGDGTRHVHLANCGELISQLKAGEVWEIELSDDKADESGILFNEDDVFLAVWDDFEPSEEELDTYAELTVFRRCVEPVLPPGAEDEEEESSGNPKADAFMDEAIAAGWDVEWEWIDNDVNSVQVIAKRGYVAGTLRTHEEIHFAWYKNRMENAFYVSGHEDDVAKKISSVAGARPYLTGTPSQPITEGKAGSRRVSREQPVKRELKVSLPFDIEEAYDDEILEKCRGRKLIWWNDTAEDYDSATVSKNGKDPRNYKIETGTAGRAILTFCSMETGFRSVALETLVQVK